MNFYLILLSCLLFEPVNSGFLRGERDINSFVELSFIEQTDTINSPIAALDDLGVFGPVEPFRNMKVPPSPQMAALGRYGEIPVNPSRGVANISIPIHTISVNGYEHNISLNYHSSGIKVNEVSSNVGLGWVLNASGVLAKTANKIGGDYVQLPSNYLEFNPICDVNDELYCDALPDYAWAEDGLDNCFDTEPDVINFNFGSHAGVMVPIDQGTYREIPFTGLTIGELESSFIIYDEMGTTYTFEEEEVVYMEPGCPGSLYVTNGCGVAGIYNSSFYLTKIVSKEGGTIDFFYEDENYIYAHNRSELYYYWVRENSCSYDPFLVPNNCLQRSSVTGKRLVRIETNENEEVIFNYKTGLDAGGTREDLPGTKALEQIEVYFKGNTTPVKRIDLSTSYHSAGSGTGTPNYEEAWGKRLKLDQVTIDAEQVYSFEYNANLSARLSYEQDWYGYHNNNGSNTSIPTITINETGETISGADRSPNPTRIKSGLLKKITFPTGGYSEFEYESNEISQSDSTTSIGPGVRIRQVSSFTDSDELAKLTEYRYVKEDGIASSGTIDNLKGAVNFLDLKYQYQDTESDISGLKECPYYQISSDDQLSSSFGRTYNPTYFRVEEIVNDGSQGLIVHHFSRLYDIIPNPPVRLASFNYDWTYGLPVKVETFKAVENGYELVEERSITYKTFITNDSEFQAEAGPNSYYSFGMKINRKLNEFKGQIDNVYTYRPAVHDLFKYGYISALVSKSGETTKTIRDGRLLQTNINYSIDSLNNQITKAVSRNPNVPEDGKARYYYYTDEIGVQTSYSSYNQPILYMDKTIDESVEYALSGGYFPLTTSKSGIIHDKAYTIDLQFPSSDYTLDLNDPADSEGIRLVSEVTLYNEKNYPLTLVRDNVSHKIMYDFFGSKPVAFFRNTNSAGRDFAYTSFETDSQGGWGYDDDFRITPNPASSVSPGFTGSFSYSLSGNSITKLLLDNSSYVLTFSVKTQNSTSGKLTVKLDDELILDSGVSDSDLSDTWLIYQYKFSGKNNIDISGDNILIDELRLQPSESYMETFGYYPLIGLRYSSDNGMNVLNFSYNSERKLSMISNGYMERIKQYFYNYRIPANF